MIAPFPNRILREMVDIQYFGGRDGLAVRRQMEELCAPRLTRAIDELLDSWGVPDDQLISIDRLEVKVDGISNRNLESELIDRIISALKAELEIKIGAPGNFKVNKLRPLRRSVFEETLFFLEHGYLPWSSGADTQWAAAAAEVLSKLEIEDHQRLIEKLQQVDTRQRFARHFPEQALQRILPALWSNPERRVILADVEKLLRELPPGAAALRLKERSVRILLDAAILSEPSEPSALCRLLAQESTKLELSPAKFITDFQSPLMRQAFADEKWVPSSKPALSEKPSEPNASASSETSPPEAKKPIAHGLSTRPEVDGGSDSKLPVAKIDDVTSDPKATRPAPAKGSERIRKQPASKAEALRDIDPIYIRNGGLVILAPYLPAFFRKLQLLADEGLRDIPSALILLHYLVFGTDECAEWELVLNKIICGVPLAYALEAPPALSPEQKAECNRLLEAVIANWPALKRTSPDGLRQTFLQREGALLQEGDTWKLRLTRTSFDVLMDQLPWTISMIQLSWMPWLLQTDWAG